MNSRSLALAQERSLAYHREIAARLRERPELVERARQRVEAWIRDGSIAERYATVWKTLLGLPLDDLLAKLTERGEAAHDLRQTSPFAGVLDPRVRWRIHRAIRDEVVGEAR